MWKINQEVLKNGFRRALWGNPIRSNTVETLPSVMEGQALQAYMDEYEKIVKTIYSKLNVNLGDFSQQLESVCQQFENLDDDMKTQLSQYREDK